MTTETKPERTDDQHAWTAVEAHKEHRLNRERFQRDAHDFYQQYPVHWIAIHSHGEIFVAHDHPKDHFEYLFQLPQFERETVFTWVTKGKTGTRWPMLATPPSRR